MADQEISAFDDDTPMEEEKDFSSNDFEFLQQLELHSAAVKAVATKTITNPDSVGDRRDLLLSGSFDHSCKLYMLMEDTGKYEFIQELSHHDHYVYDVASNHGEGFLTAGKDKRIFLIDNNGNPEKMFEGHENLVNSVMPVDDRTIVSGSWDGTAKVWDLESTKCIATLEGHSHAVSLFVTPEGKIITGSQDNKIRIWGKNYKLEKEWDAHKDIVRKFADYSPVGFVSCSNDGSIKIWTYDGDLLGELTGHTSYVFTVLTLPNNVIVSGSDDRSIKIWKDMQCVQTIECPNTIWDIKTNMRGDLVVASQDCRIYTFTRDPSKAATGKELSEFKANIEAANKGGEIDTETLPTTAEMPQHVGKKDGEIKIFKDADIPKAYAWKEAERKWDLIGEVQLPSGPPKETTKHYEGDRLFEAGEYDHVFDVEIGDGVMRKLPFNNGGNPDEAANKFWVREGFGKQNLEQITQFIKTNSSSFATRDLSGGVQDTGPVKPKLKSFPMQTCLFYDAVKTAKPAEKIRETNAELNTIEEKHFKHLDRLIEVISDKTHYHSSELYKGEWDVFKQLLSWPYKHILPVLDLFRMFLCHSQASEMFKVYEHGWEHLTKFLSILELKDEPMPVHLMSLRCLVNMFKHPSSVFIMVSKYEKILDTVADYISHENKNVRNAAITVFLSYSIAFLTRKENNEGRVQSIACLSEALEQEKDANNYMRVLAAIGNLMFEDEEVQSLARDLGVEGKLASVEGFKGKDVYEKCVKYAEEIKIMLS